MYKKLLCGIAVIAFAAIVGMNVKMSNSQDSKMTDLNLANVEALANSECTALPRCGSNCPYEYCGYCWGFYMTECHN